MAFRVVVLVSGTGTLLQSLIDNLPEQVSIVAVGSDQPDAVALQRAQAVGIPTFAEPLPRSDAQTTMRAAWDTRLTDAVARFDPDLVVCAGFMKLLGQTFLDRFGGRTINSTQPCCRLSQESTAPAMLWNTGSKLPGLLSLWLTPELTPAESSPNGLCPSSPTTPSSPFTNASR